MKIAVVGASGMLGRVLHSSFQENHQVVPLTRRELDVTSFCDVRRKLAAVGPDWVVHAAAYTHVDRAEEETKLAFQVNGLGTRNLAAASFETRSRLLYYSTDYVFDGSLKRPYREWDRTNPINQYGRSKWLGEEFVRSLCPDHLILRTSWLYGPGGHHFVDRIIELGRSSDRLSVVDDQRGSPTYTFDLARASLTLIESERRGIYHVTNSGDCSWHQFALRILDECGCSTPVDAVDSAAHPTRARRPKNSVLENALLTLDGFDPLRPWEDAVAEYLGRRS